MAGWPGCRGMGGHPAWPNAHYLVRADYALRIPVRKQLGCILELIEMDPHSEL